MTGANISNTDLGFQFFTPFDPSLGTLTKVDVEISGTVATNATLPASLVCGIGCVPSPYLFDLTIEHDFGFGFLTDPQVRYVGIASGFSGAYTSVVEYNHVMSFNAITDLVGIAPVASSATSVGGIESVAPGVIPAVGATLLQQNFSNGLGIPLFSLQPIMTYTLSGGVGLGGPMGGAIASDGTIMLAYTFEDGVVAIPEPSPLLLFSLGIAGLAFTRLRKI